jgi:PadR family transcriptional regulator PadR
MYGLPRSPSDWKHGAGLLRREAKRAVPVLRNLDAAGLLAQRSGALRSAGPPRPLLPITNQGARTLRAWMESWTETRDFVDHVLQGTRP